MGLGFRAFLILFALESIRVDFKESIAVIKVNSIPIVTTLLAYDVSGRALFLDFSRIRAQLSSYRIFIFSNSNFPLIGIVS